MRRISVGLAVIALVLLGCDPSHAFAVDNQTDHEFTVRITETTYADEFGSTVSYFSVPANTKAYAFPSEIGALKGSVDVLDGDCNLVGTVEARSGSIVTIHDDQSLDLRYFGNEDEGLGGQLAETDNCP